MKKLFFIPLFLLSISMLGQINVIKTEPLVEIGKVGAFGSNDVSIRKDESSKTYFFSYKDITYKQLTNLESFSFVDEKNAFDNLYNMIIKGFDDMPESDIVLELPRTIVSLHFTKAMGIVNFQFIQNKNGVMSISRYLTKKQVNKLFGKTE